MITDFDVALLIDVVLILIWELSSKDYKKV